VLRHAAATPAALAVAGPDGSLTYGELDRLARRIARWLVARGVGRGDRVALWLEKSALAVAAMQAVLRCGAGYVPIDPLSPPARCRALLADCGVAALVSTERRAAAVLTGELGGIPCLCTDGHDRDRGWPGTPAAGEEPPPPESPPCAGAGGDDLAYILYTSGSTGRPKGVAVSHRNALAFTRWAEDELAARPDDRFANHAPFHFDLSVLDLYVAFQAGASVHLVPDASSFAPGRLVRFVAEQRPTVWYSVPSALVMMMEHGGLLELDEVSWRAVLFAGEPFPVKHLRRLRERWPEVRLLNLYGPTETNVCTCFEVGERAPEIGVSLPIGSACCGDRVWARRDDGAAAGPGEIGEAMVEGPTVMIGYWGEAPQAGPYATGDLVRVLAGGGFEFLGRRDHMVKLRGHRIDLGEVESALAEHPAVREAAVVVGGSGLAARLIAFVASGAVPPPSLLALKEHCAARLPRYMIVDRVRVLDELPRTRTGKVDRLALATRAAAADQREGA